nr:MAG TPA: hypothetical protein [Caudoviricetes sp.]
MSTIYILCFVLFYSAKLRFFVIMRRTLYVFRQFGVSLACKRLVFGIVIGCLIG